MSGQEYFILQYPNEETDVYVIAPRNGWCTIDVDREAFLKNYIVIDDKYCIRKFF